MDHPESTPTDETLDAGQEHRGDCSPCEALFPADMPATGVDAGIDLRELARRPTLKGSSQVTCLDYGTEKCLVQQIADLPEFLAKHRAEWSKVRWIRIQGLQDMETIRAIAEKYQLHPLAIEDVLTTQRPKVEDYPGSGENPGRLFVVARMIDQVKRRLIGKQVSFFLGRHTLITFEESESAIFDPVRSRIETPGSRVRANDASFLLYSLLHATVDAYFPLLERSAERIERLERAVLTRPTAGLLQHIHRLRKDMMTIRRAAWPMRELILELRREGHECFSENTRTYLREVYDHVLVIFDLSESYRDTLATLTDTYMSSVANRMNEIMKTLTIISTIFVPLTFLAGVYGMNMPIPENTCDEIKDYTYPAFWLISLSTIFGMLWWFRRRNWF